MGGGQGGWTTGPPEEVTGSGAARPLLGSAWFGMRRPRVDGFLLTPRAFDAYSDACALGRGLWLVRTDDGAYDLTQPGASSGDGTSGV